jgi:hypothetical protein
MTRADARRSPASVCYNEVTSVRLDAYHPPLLLSDQVHPLVHGSLKMQRSNTLVKMTTIVSSVFLLGAFVSYRAGAFNWLMKPSSPAAVPMSVPPVETNKADATTPTPPTIMYSTKSAPVFDHSKTPQLFPETPPPTASKSTIMPGPKSGIILDVPSYDPARPPLTIPKDAVRNNPPPPETAQSNPPTPSAPLPNAPSRPNSPR